MAASLLVLWTVGAAQAAPPETFPEMAHDTADVAYVVARIAPGADLPDPPKCAPTGDVLCFDSSFWFHAKVTQVLAGDIGRSLEVATISHYGMQGFDRYKDPVLLRLHTDGRHVVMPRYALATLAPARSGELYLILEPSRRPYLLPCGIEAAEEPIDARMFRRSIAIPPGGHHYAAAAQAPDRYLVTKAGAVPRYGIPMRRLQAVLAAMTPKQRRESCSAVAD